MRILGELCSAINVQQTVEKELLSRNKLLPPRWGDAALAEAVPSVVQWFESLARSEIHVEGEEVVLARKLGRGARPISVMGLKERLIYRAVVSLVEEVVGPVNRCKEAHEAFLRAPLEDDHCEYVLKADIASYYQYVDHERLIDEVVAQTGDDLAVTAAVELLGEATNRRFGLPQLSQVSDVLAEIYIDPMRRDLVRGRFRATRFADDFRIACRDYGEALRALEATDEAARALGLVLNELKTATPGREKYEASLSAARDRERQLFASLDVDVLDELDFGEYSDVAPLSPDGRRDSLLDEPGSDEANGLRDDESDDLVPVSPTQIAAAIAVVKAWIEEVEDDDPQRSERARITAALLGRGLRVLTRAGDPSVLEHVAHVLVYEPSLTPTVARYIRHCGRVDGEFTRHALDGICDKPILSAWQALWVASVAGDLPKQGGGSEFPHVSWLRQQVESRHSGLAAESTLALARRGLIGAGEVTAALARVPALHRPTVLLALTAIGEDELAKKAADTELDRVRIRWGFDHLA